MVSNDSSNPFGRYQSPDQVYDKRLRSWLNIGLFLCFIIASIVMVGLAIWTVIILLKHEKRPFAIAAIVSLVPFAVVLAMVGFNNLPTCLIAYLKPKIKSKTERRYMADLSNTWFVGIAPGQSLTIFGGDSCLDVGFLSIEPGRLLFYGDIVEFQLKSVQVTDLILQKGYLSFGLFSFQITRVLISWKHPALDDVQYLAIELGDCCRLFGRSKSTLELFSILSAWQIEAVSSSTSRQFEPPPREDEFSDLVKIPVSTFGPSCLVNLAAYIGVTVVIRVITDFNSIWYSPHGKLKAILPVISLLVICLVAYKQSKRPAHEGNQ
jgi:hypothetical protein